MTDVVPKGTKQSWDWAEIPGGSGDMTKAVYDPDADGVIATGQIDVAALKLLMYPVGAIYQSVVSTDPGTLFGGTWAALGAGRVLVGIDAGDADFDTVEETGGEKTHTLTEAEMPVHTHIQDQHRHQILRERSATTGSQATQIARTADTSSTVDTAIYTEYTTPTNQNAGSGSAHNNVQPYIVVYRWKRTA